MKTPRRRARFCALSARRCRRDMWRPCRVWWLGMILGACGGLPVLSSVAVAQSPAWIGAWQRWPSVLAHGSETAGGELLWSELRCGACHKVSDDWQERLATPPAPRLEAVGTRTRVAYLRRFLLDPASTQPGTLMPHLLHAVEPQERAAIVERLVHFLVALGEPAHEDLPIIGFKDRGAQLYRTVGCAACHGHYGNDATTMLLTQPLLHLRDKYTLNGLVSFLTNPLAFRPAARMPDLRLSTDEARSIAAFLLELPEVYRLRYAYYEGRWNELPDFDHATPVEVGGTDRLDVSRARRRDFFGFRFDGWIRLERAGMYRFWLASDDGARLWINNRLIIDNDEIHATQEKQADVKLDAGTYPVRIEYFEHAGEEVVRCDIQGPGLARQRIDELFVGQMADSEKNADRGQVTVPVDRQLAADGRQLFVRFGCAACHAVDENGSRLEPQLERPVPPAASLRSHGGCLAENPSPASPHYALSDAHRLALRQLVERMRQSAHPLTAQERLRRTLATFQCYACHERDKIGGVAEPFDAFFQTTTPEMGDEGRIPPSLNGVGAKLTRRWLTKIFSEGAKDRPYMLTRMPRFGTDAVGHLTTLWEELDRMPSWKPVSFPVPIAEVKAMGWAMVGEGGFGCVKCHTFGSFPAQGIQSINLQLMHDRLQPAWFHQYMRNPAVFRPGTRMPSAWPAEGPSLLDYLGADSQLQIAAIWEYLSDGERARVPAGVLTPSMELVPVERAIIYRNFIAGAGARAIAVGFPEGVHIAFDAENLRLALLWQGRFLDASKHWTGRGDGFQPPAGEKVLQLVDGVPLAILKDRMQPWPSQSARQLGYRFSGYRTTTDQRPTFLYQYAGVQVEDCVNPRGVGRTDPVPRTLRFLPIDSQTSNLDGELWLRAAAGHIVRQDTHRYQVNNAWQLEIRAASEILLRSSEGREELLVRVPIEEPTATVQILYSW